MKILIACEESQAVTKAFRAKGHEAYSCDILDCSGGHPEWHIQDDVKCILQKDWDMVLAFPPCTHLAVSGAAHFAQKKADGRQQEGIDFFMLFANLDHVPKVAIENPIGIMSKIWRKPDQIIQPYNFGDDASKRTCLWLKGLPLLKETIRVNGRMVTTPSGKVVERWSNQCDNYGHDKTGPSADRSRIRSKTYLGIANAMADQWSMKFEEEIEAPEEISCVIVNGEKIPVDNVEFLNVEEDVYGRDLMTFVYNGETRQSCIVKQYR